MLFKAFDKHQYYNIKDLVNITKQPVVSINQTSKSKIGTSRVELFKIKNIKFSQLQSYLKEILKEVCNHNMKNPHKNMWELKPEYRHYNKEETPAADPAPGPSTS